MISIKNGILKINSEEAEKPYSHIYELGFFITITLYFLFYTTRKVNAVAVIFGVLCTAMLIFGKLQRSKLEPSMNTAWYFIFFVFAELSFIWAYAPASSVQVYLRVMTLITIFGFGMVQYISSAKDFHRLTTIFLIAIGIIAVIELLATPVEEWTNGFFGGKVGGNNTNLFGFLCMISAILSFYKGYYLKKRYWYAPTLLFLFCCVLSSSRKALILSVAGILLLIAFAFKRKNHIKHLILTILLTLFALVLIIEDKVLYDIIGFRIVALFDFYQNGTGNYSISQGSLGIRAYFIDFAKELFRQKPILGNGFANFSVIVGDKGETGTGVYAHNNYWEILADLGIVGFILYYWFYAYMGIKLITKLIKDKTNGIASLGLSMLLTLVILEWGVVSMSSFLVHIVITFIYATSKIETDGIKKYHYIESRGDFIA